MRMTIGASSSVHLGAHIDCASGLTIGTSTTVNMGSRLDSRGGLTIGDNVSISAHVTILSADHNIHSARMEGSLRPVSIGDFAFIGTNALILPGVSIGRGAVVAAGAVVPRDVDDYCVVAGSPARKIGDRNPDFDYTASYKRLFF